MLNKRNALRMPPRYARPSFWTGVASIFDFGGALNRYSVTTSGSRADALAMWADWQAVGDDMRAALQAYRAEREDKAACRTTRINT